MIKPDESAVTVFRVEVRPVPRQNVGMQVDFHSKEQTSSVQRSAPNVEIRKIPLLFLLLLLIEFLKGFHWLRFFDLLAALLAGTARIVIPEIEHGLAEVLNDICAVEMNVFH